MSDTTATPGWYTPMLRVARIERSIPFYEQLGFELIDTDRCAPIGWARMHWSDTEHTEWLKRIGRESV